MLFKIRQDHDVFEDNPGLLAVEKYAKLTDQQMKVVILICDPSKDNPIRSLSGKARRERAAIIAGYKMESDGKRLDKNGRNVVYGQVPSIESAIEEFKKNHYDEKQHSIDALKKQIEEIRAFLTGDKNSPMMKKNGDLVKDEKGETLYETDYKALEAAVKLGERLPALEEALDRLAALSKTDEPKFEGLTGTVSDLGDDFEEQTSEGSTLDRVNESLRKNDI